MNISLANLSAAGIGPTQARAILDPLLSTLARFDITTPARAGGFVAQCWVESLGFTDFEENLRYTDAARVMRIFPSRVTSIEQAQRLTNNPQGLANCVYAGKNGNGNPMSGDGWKFRGRGAIQLTGRSNYTDAANECGRPYLEQPDLVGQVPDALLTAGWYWHSRKLNFLADASHWDEITRAINGPGMEQSGLRRQRSEECTRAFA
jgi:putative chitinase